ncbi:DNA-3-methyladenine glycosylase 2 family protein [Radiobacillus kanasensis]|uniref:DNA-3-methyladenine glycosylase family protein n=1 Tax=Radiobacillus kanasensis TaxID=2844358 RepID=UPI001E4BE862|nr:DNA-3-methyladenine glycosylase 2 family protein [Radiobacillus kanasensis]UFU00170.1 DNA-3-methyladenine glycosylase 2 family protein [Radiobacillus kanasensis]
MGNRYWNISLDNQSVKQLCMADNKVKKLALIIGDYYVPTYNDKFEALIRYIVGQMLSNKVANNIWENVKQQLSGVITQKTISELSDPELRALGLSMRKVGYIRDLCNRIKSNDLDLEQLEELNNNQIIKKLTRVKGIGVWTAEMFLIFTLYRQDVIPLDDVSLQRCVSWLYAENNLSSKELLKQKGSVWSPNSSIACLYLWEAVNREYVDNYLSIEDVKK